jgi:hypothetical protein
MGAVDKILPQEGEINMYKKVINKNYEFKTNLDLTKFQWRGERFITSLLHPTNPEKDIRAKIYSPWKLQFITFLYDFKQQLVTPGTCVVYSKTDFYGEIIKCVVQKPELDKLFKKHNLYDPDTFFHTIYDVLYSIDIWPEIDACSGISVNTNTVILYRDLLPDSQGQELPSLDFDNDYRYVEDEDERFGPWSDFDQVIRNFIRDLTDEVITELSEEEFYENFIKYVKYKYSSDSPDSYDPLLSTLAYWDSIEDFYLYICEYRGLINYKTPLCWSLGSGYVVLINNDKG